MTPLTEVTTAAWALVEIGVRIREGIEGRGRSARDRGTRVLIALSLAVAIIAALALPFASAAVGVPMMWCGLALRVWAIATLGRAFRTTVEVEPDQTVVSTGPFRWVRHPSYTGLLLIVAGFGAAVGGWLGLPVCLIVPLPAVVWRIHVEEAELDRVLGEAYAAYRSGRARLLPKVW